MVFAVKYIALLAMVKIVPTHPELVAEYQDMIMSSVNDEDVSIRMRALDLVSAMVCIFEVAFRGGMQLEAVLTRNSLGQPTQSATHPAATFVASGQGRTLDASLSIRGVVPIRPFRGAPGRPAKHASVTIARLSPDARPADTIIRLAGPVRACHRLRVVPLGACRPRLRRPC